MRDGCVAAETIREARSVEATHVGDRLEDIERRGDSTVRSEKATLLLYNAAAATGESNIKR